MLNKQLEETDTSTKDKTVEKTKFQFSVDSAILRELGERLVSTVHVALSELVKNSYDADATEVKIKINHDLSNGTTIFLEDNGMGMTKEEVSKFWMRIGTTNKESQSISKKYGRLRAGSKGVGRFSCRRLGERLQLETIAHVLEIHTNVLKTSRIIVDFDWDKFTPGTLVEEIPCQGTIEFFDELRPTGTKLVIKNLGENEWTSRGYKYLRRQLALMAGNSGKRRIGFKEDPGFKVSLSAPDQAEETEDIREGIIDASWATLEAEVRPTGVAVFTLRASGLGGKKSFTTKNRFASVAGAKLRLGILPSGNNQAGLRDPSLLANYVLNNLINDWGGVQIRYNGFRMFPYGDSGDDWLHLDADRGRRLGKPEDEEIVSFADSLHKNNSSRVMLNMLGMRNYIGQVDVTSEINGLSPRIDRQGFVQNSVFEDLRTVVRLAIDWATIQREYLIREKSISDTKDAVDEVVPFLDGADKEQINEAPPKVANFLRREIHRIVTALPEAEQKQTRDFMLKSVSALEAISADSLNQLSHLRLVATASTLTLLFAHEVRSSISTIGAGAARLRTIAKKLPVEFKNEVEELSKDLSGTQTQLSQLIDMTGIVGAFRKEQKAINLNLRAAVEKATSYFRLVLQNYQISIDLEDLNKSVMVGPLVAGEMYAILVNLISNAVKSLIAKGNSDRKIKFSSTKISAKVVLHIMDNGIGLDPEHFNDVFTPFISDPSGQLYDRLEENMNPEDSSAFGTGSGLGLAISRDIARARRGDIRFILPPENWAACIEVELP